jgi:hypothetical protein
MAKGTDSLWLPAGLRCGMWDHWGRLSQHGCGLGDLLGEPVEDAGGVLDLGGRHGQQLDHLHSPGSGGRSGRLAASTS